MQLSEMIQMLQQELAENGDATLSIREVLRPYALVAVRGKGGIDIGHKNTRGFRPAEVLDVWIGFERDADTIKEFLS
jgi:hypothetical protein